MKIEEFNNENMMDRGFWTRCTQTWAWTQTQRLELVSSNRGYPQVEYEGHTTVGELYSLHCDVNN